jgi:predicted nucleotidyltransferase
MNELHELFFTRPMQKFGVRELARLTHIDTKTVMKRLKVMMSKGIVVKVKTKGSYPHYEANRLSKQYTLAKTAAIIGRLAETGLVDFLEQKLNPKAIVLYGSAQKGTYLKDSDIDLFVQGNEVRVNLSGYEEKLGHEIHLFFESDLENLTDGMRNNVISGMTLSGGLRI